MNDEAREQLLKMIGNYGSAVCNTPRSCELFVHQFCGQFKDETKALIQALQKGTVTELLRLKADQWGEASGPLTARLAEQSGLSEPEAQWAVESWAIALGKHPASGALTPKQPRILVEQSQVVGKQVTAASFGTRVMMITVAGAIGGMIGSVAGLGVTIMALEYARLFVEGTEAEQQVMEFGMAFVLGTLALYTIAGALGALGGAVLVQGQRTSYAGRAAAGAVMGALFFSALGFFLCALLSPVLAFVGGLVGALAGSFSGSIGGGYGG